MAITTLDGVLAGMQWPRYFAKTVTPTLVAGKPQSLWGLSGAPTTGNFDTTINGITLSNSVTATTGSINFIDPSGTSNTYLARFQGGATIAGTLLLCDRLWHNGGMVITSAATQPVNSVTWPSRDVTGGTGGSGVLIGLEISAAAGAAAPTISISYTNELGVAGRLASNVFATANSPVAGSFFQIGLQSGDQGVRSIQNIALGVSWVSGTMNLVAYRVLAALELPSGNIPNAIDAITSGFPRMYNGTVPFLIFIPSTTTPSNISGQVVYSQG